MRLYLVKNQHLFFEQNTVSFNNALGIVYRSATVKAILTPPEHSSLTKVFGEKLGKLLLKEYVNVNEDTLSRNLRINIGAPLLPGHAVPHVNVSEDFKNEDNESKGDLLETIHRLTNGNVRVKLKMKNFGSVHIYTNDLQDRRMVNSTDNIDNYRVELSTTPMEITRTNSSQTMSAKGDLPKFPASFSTFWQEGNCVFRGLFTVALIMDDNLAELGVPVTERFCINRQILNEEIVSDVVIKAGNGSLHKCHKNFLCAHSPVLRAMFETNMEESQTNTINMSDLSEEGVKAFLEYIYTWNIDRAEEECSIAFELFYAAHKYDISRLELCMSNLMLSKQDSWFQSEAAFNLFLFTRNNMEKWKDLTTKAVQVLKMNVSNLDDSIDYQTAFKEDPTAGLELCKYAFSTK